MPQIRTSLFLAALCLLGALALAGCGDSNSQAVFTSDTGKHPDGWVPAGHQAGARANLNSCVDCHGENLEGGGISKVACTQCHSGPGFAIHPLGWGQFAYARHADFVQDPANGTASCATAICHGSDLLGGSTGGPSCAINCHMAGAAQAPQKHAWVGNDIDGHRNYFASNPRNYNTCRNNACHGGQGSNVVPPGVFLSGPGCLSIGCHTPTGTPGNPLPVESN
jgi:hypothetical protein